MHSFHPSRAKILFEAVCALVISASLVGAWMQTGASALLAAASVAALYGLIHASDMRSRNASIAADPKDCTVATDDQGDLLMYLDAGELEPSVEPEVAQLVEEVEPEPAPAEDIAQAAEPAKPRRQRKSRKSPKAAKSAQPMAEEQLLVAQAVEDAEPAEPAPADDAEIDRSVEEAEPAEPKLAWDADHPHIEPLFEPEPFVRQQRAVFGRKAG